MQNWSERLEAACERLLHPSVADAAERGRQRRLLLVLFGGAVLLAAATAQAMAVRLGGATALAAASVMFAGALLAPSLLIATGRRQLVEPAALTVSALAAAVPIAAGGGLASPLALMAAALAIEASWEGRTRVAFIAGLAAALAALAVAAGLKAIFFADAAASGWLWVVPLLYGVSLAARLPLPFLAEEPEVVEEKRERPVEEVIGAAVLRMHRSGDVAHASPQARALLGVAPEMLLGSGLFDRIQVADRVAYLQALADLREGAERCRLRLRLRVAGERTGAVYRAFIADLVPEPEGSGMVAMLRDDDATSALEEALVEAREAAESAAIARDRFVASVSHELRTPLNAIVGFSDVLANEMFGRFANERQREYVELIREASGHLLAVVNAALDVSKLQSGAYSLQAESFSFAETVEWCLAMAAQQAAARSIALKADIAEDVGVVHCDRRALRQVLINLLSNAVKFTPSGEVKVTARRVGDRLDFTVSDTGIGISSEDLERVGTPFMQVENGYARQGTGLGLALVKGLVALQGGGVSIESAPGAGTRVHVSLPVGLTGGQEEQEMLSATRSGADWSDEWSDESLRKTA